MKWTAIALFASTLAQAQLLPEPKDLTVIQSAHNSNITLSYKESHICETTPGVSGFSGYVDLPPGILSDLGVTNQTWPIHTFFWYFQSRKDPQNSPTMIWINGGPGGSSSGNPLGYNGPCRVHPNASATYINDWSWNREFNMLYVDQPVQVGLSYTTQQNISYGLVSGNVTILNDTSPLPEQNSTLVVGTWSERDTYKGSFGSVQGAYAFWKFAQVFFQEFPDYKCNANKLISISGVSYGGKYAPAIFAFFEEQNERIRNGTWTVPGQTQILPLDTIQIESGCVDLPSSWFSYPEMAVNNTYGIKGVNESTVAQMLDDLNREGGCLDQAYQCGNASLQYDPGNMGANETVNDICRRAGKFCNENVQGSFSKANRSFYDITVTPQLSRAPPFSRAFLQRPSVQEALGHRVNWTSGTDVVGQATDRFGDFGRPGWPQKLAYLLERGIKVAFVYGDKDYICNWFGGEAVSKQVNHTDQAKFLAAGYEPIHTNDSYIGGVVRQYGNLSFSRVYQAGHGAAGQQPETAYQIIRRVLLNLDIATGTKPVTTQDGTLYRSEGPSDSLGFTNEVLPVDVLQVCYLMDVNATCTDEQKKMISNGTAVIKEYMVVDKNSTARYPEIVGDGLVEMGDSAVLRF